MFNRCPDFACVSMDVWVEMLLECAVADGKLVRIVQNGVVKFGLP